MKPSASTLRRKAQAVQLLVMDVDGVLTDGGLYFGPRGEIAKRFDVKDGQGLTVARLVGLRTAIITGRKSLIVKRRANELGVSFVLQGRRNKQTALRMLLRHMRISASQVAYIGDDLNDLAAMSEVELSACPRDASAEIQHIAHYRARAAGGHGAVREIVELILKAQGKWETARQIMRGANTAPK